MEAVVSGVRAPSLDVRLSTGEVVPLQSLYESEKLLLVFLRHFGCVFCREFVSELRRMEGANIAFVTLANPEQAEDFRQKQRSPHRFLCDPEKTLHAHFNLQRGGMAQMVSPEVILRGVKAVMSGHLVGRPVGDPLQMPGVFLIDTDGTVSWEYRSKDASDNPSVELVEEKMRDA